MSCRPSMPSTAKDSSDIVYINSLIDKSQSDCLNHHPDYPLSNIFNCSSSMFLRSDADAELLMNFVFS